MLASCIELFGLTVHALSAVVILDFARYKRTGVVGTKLKTLVKLLEVLPISSAKCERGFSQMNLQHTSSRNRLMTETVSDLLMICINGPPLSHWNATKYVVSWLQSGKLGAPSQKHAFDKPMGVAKKEIEMPKSC
jgi:hypothetical protein